MKYFCLLFSFSALFFTACCSKIENLNDSFKFMSLNGEWKIQTLYRYGSGPDSVLEFKDYPRLIFKGGPTESDAADWTNNIRDVFVTGTVYDSLGKSYIVYGQARAKGLSPNYNDFRFMRGDATLGLPFPSMFTMQGYYQVVAIDADKIRLLCDNQSFLLHQWPSVKRLSLKPGQLEITLTR